MFDRTSLDTMERLADWPYWVHERETTEPVSAVRRSGAKGQPHGSPAWVQQLVAQWNLGATWRGRGRPKKEFTNNGS